MKKLLCLLLALSLILPYPMSRAAASTLPEDESSAVESTLTVEEPETNRETESSSETETDTRAENDSDPAESPTEETDPCADGHTPDEGVVSIRSTGIDGGIKTYHCSVCGEFIRDDVIPAIISTTNNDKGIKVTWTKVTGASSYRLYCKEDDGAWKSVVKTKKNTYTVTGRTSGKRYTFRVVTLNKKGKWIGTSAYYDTVGVSAIWYKVPTLVSAAATAEGIKLTWKAVPGTTKYRVLRKPSGGSWERVEEVEGVTSYVFTGLPENQVYYFSVRAVDPEDSSIYGYFNTTGKKNCYVAPVSGTNVRDAAAGSMLVNWNAAPNASGYEIQYAADKAFSKNLKSVTFKQRSAAYRRLTGLTNDTTWYVRMRAYYTSGKTKYYSVWDTAANAYVNRTEQLSALPAGSTALGKPTVTASAPSLTSAKLTWTKVSGADGYFIYRKNSDGWLKLKTIKADSTLSYTDDTITSAGSYTYAVAAYGASGSEYVIGPPVQATAKVSYTQKIVNGYTLFYDTKGKLIKNTVDIVKTKSPYYIRVNLTCNTVHVYAKDSAGKYTIPVRVFVCSVGTATPTGTYKTPEKYRWHELMGNCYGQWCTRITGGILFHSIFYDENYNNKTLSVSAYNKLGTTASHGCVRLTAADAKWIYDNCALGTQVNLYRSNDPGPFGKPSAVKLASWHTWDPTDPNAQSYCKAKKCHAYS